MRLYGIPKDVVRAAYDDNPAARGQMLESLSKVRELLIELGLVTRLARLIWRKNGLWEA